MSNGSNPLFGGNQWMGVCYHLHQDVTPDSVAADIDLIKTKVYQYHLGFGFIRTYTAIQGSNQYIVPAADAAGVKVALGAWIVETNGVVDWDATHAEIDGALKQASDYQANGTVPIVVIGNEVDLHISYRDASTALDYAKTQRKNYPNLANIPLTVCFTGTAPTKPDWPSVVSDCEEYVFLTIYPWYGQKQNNNFTPGDIVRNMSYSHDHGMAQVEHMRKTVVIAEIGWPSDSNDPTGLYTTCANERTNYAATLDWINGNNQYNTAYITMWFEMFDEPWKCQPPGKSWECHFGLYTSDRKCKFIQPGCN